jgi:hypothetical protein
MLLFNKPPQTQATATATTKTMTTPAPDLTRVTLSSTTATAASSSMRVPPYLPAKFSRWFNIASPKKPKLVIKLIFEMDTPPKAPLMRQLVKGSAIFIETHNDHQKRFAHIPKCSNEASATCCKPLSMNSFRKFSIYWELEQKMLLMDCTKGHYGFVGEW